MNNRSVDCDYDPEPSPMIDIGILAWLDPVELDQTCVDLVYLTYDGKGRIERKESCNGIHTLEQVEGIGLESRSYILISIDCQHSFKIYLYFKEMKKELFFYVSVQSSVKNYFWFTKTMSEHCLSYDTIYPRDPVEKLSKSVYE